MKHGLTLALCLLVFAAAGISFGERLVKGVVKDAEGKPVPGVKVSIAKLGYETVTDRDGLFVIPGAEGFVAIDCTSDCVPRWCGLQRRYRQTLTEDQLDQRWDEIRLKGVLLEDADGRQKWLFRTNAHELIDNMDGTVTDCETGLMWASMSPMDSMGIMPCWTWDEAKRYCRELNLAGYTDWGLPSLAQLESLPHGAVHGGPIDSLAYWWSSELTGDDQAWVVKQGIPSQQDRLCHNAVLPVRMVER
jgi:hypothetical protein